MKIIQRKLVYGCALCIKRKKYLMQVDTYTGSVHLLEFTFINGLHFHASLF